VWSGRKLELAILVLCSTFPDEEFALHLSTSRWAVNPVGSIEPRRGVVITSIFETSRLTAQR